MKEPLVSNQQEVKMEWEGGRQEGNSPQVSQTSADEQSSAENPRSVITTRRHVRTITTAGHITEGAVVDPESESPVPSPVASNLQQVIQQQQQHRHVASADQEQPEQQHQHQQRYQQEEQHSQQQFIQVSRGSSPGDGREQHHITYAANGQESAEVHESGETSITIAVSKEPPR